MAEHPKNKERETEQSESRRKQVEREEMTPQKMKARGAEYNPGTMWGINWPASITGWFVSLIVGMLFLAVAGAIFGPIITAGFALKELLTGTAGVIAAVVLLAIAFVSYFIGGWIAGRLAGFNGVLNGIMTVVVGLIVAFVFGIVAAVLAGSIVSFISAAVPGFLVANIASLLSISGFILLIVQVAGAALGGWFGERAVKMMPMTA
jgi:hypothetical protein